VTEDRVDVYSEMS